MVNPKKTWDWCLKKPLNPMTIISIKKKKLKPNKMFTAKSSKQKDIKHARWSINSQHPKSAPKQSFHNYNLQWNTFPTSMPFSSHESPICMTRESYYSVPYFYPSWSYNSYMLFLPRNFCLDYIKYKKLPINQQPPTNNDCFDHRN